ncbi:MAG: hypothetical protein OXR72_04230 [Gemmatimonadota bacterium]|nr:hypothetical protein [Gemmatimonadota bacterium]
MEIFNQVTTKSDAFCDGIGAFCDKEKTPMRSFIGVICHTSRATRNRQLKPDSATSWRSQTATCAPGRGEPRKTKGKRKKAEGRTEKEKGRQKGPEKFRAFLEPIFKT